MEKLNEYKDYPKWINELSAEQQYQWYLTAKKSLSTFQQITNTNDLEQAIIAYEKKHNIE